MSGQSIEIPDYKVLKQYFLKHVRSFGMSNDRVKAHFYLKISHTFNVVSNVREIALKEGMDSNNVNLASPVFRLLFKSVFVYILYHEKLRCIFVVKRIT